MMVKVTVINKMNPLKQTVTTQHNKYSNKNQHMYIDQESQ
jgi:hypothetical protein